MRRSIAPLQSRPHFAENRGKKLVLLNDRASTGEGDEEGEDAGDRKDRSGCRQTGGDRCSRSECKAQPERDCAKDKQDPRWEETGCCVQDKQRETSQLYAIAAVRAKLRGRTQQSLRSCPDRAQT